MRGPESISTEVASTSYSSGKSDNGGKGSVNPEQEGHKSVTQPSNQNGEGCSKTGCTYQHDLLIFNDS